MKPWQLSLLLAVLAPRCGASVAIITAKLPSGKVNTAYSSVVVAHDGCAPFKWQIVSGALPAGVTATPTSATTSLILKGTPTAAGTDSFVVQVTGCGGHVSQATYSIVVNPDLGVAITTASLPNGTANTAYSAAVLAHNGCTPFKWNIASGALPAGVTATPSSTTTSLNLKGTPTAAGTDPFVVQVTGCGGSVSQASYQVVIQGAANHVVDLSWKASTSANIAGYNVYRCPDGVTWKKINASMIGSTIYSDSTVANKTTYYYATTAVDTVGAESGMSGAVVVAIP